jgi:hypothetical protein
MASNGARQQGPTLKYRMATWGHVRPKKSVRGLRACGYSWAEIGSGSASPARPRSNAGEQPENVRATFYTASRGAVCGGVTTGIFWMISDSRVSGEEDP